MITYQEAIQKLLNEADRTLESQLLDWKDAQRRIVAKDCYAQIDSPPFSNAAMDGYAVQAKKLANASKAKPVILTVGQAVFAGDTKENESNADAIPIMTGAKVPKGYDSVVRIEDTKQREDSQVAFFTKVKPGENKRDKGTDFKRDSLILKKGEEVTPFNTLSAIAAGIRQVEVWKKIRIGLVATGDEIESVTNSKPLTDGQIYDSNMPALQAYLEAQGCEVVHVGKIKDLPSLLETKIRYFTQQEIDIIITIGAVSKGAKDFIPSVFEAQGATCLFHRVAIRPGKPIYAGLMRKDKPILCLGFPGNPISSLVAARFFLYPYIRHIQGLAQEKPFIAKSVNSFQRKNNRLRYFLKAKYVATQGGNIEVKILDGQESYKSYPLVQANCWVMVQEDKQSIQEGELVTCYLMS